MPLKRCACGRDVRLRAQKVTSGHRRGVMHWIEHADGTPIGKPAGDDGWVSVQMKPYPVKEGDREYAKLIQRWDTR